MLDSVEIRGYRCIENLKLDDLGNINLITGKNNTGKSTLLEAIAIYALQANLIFIDNLLKEHGEESLRLPLTHVKLEDVFKSITSLFYRRNPSYDESNWICITGKENTNDLLTVSIRFVKYYLEDEIEIQNGQQVITRRHTKVIDKDLATSIEFKIALELSIGKIKRLIPLEDLNSTMAFMRKSEDTIKCEFINTKNIDRSINGILWDKIALTEKEKYVIEALRIIEPKTERITFIDRTNRERVAVIKIHNEESISPIKSMGDGINRILTIILALVNCDSGYLLIDEFENGLHYSVQEQLWEIIFSISSSLNIQVFVTTHSEDCIRSFTRASEKFKENLHSKLIRLENKNSNIKTVDFSLDELKIASDNNIETR
jgi:AAA15 family ATPase/GTPase